MSVVPTTQAFVLWYEAIYLNWRGANIARQFGGAASFEERPEGQIPSCKVAPANYPTSL